MKKSIVILFFVAALLLVGGVFVLKRGNDTKDNVGTEKKKETTEAMSKEAFDATNKTLARHKITGVRDLDGPYKKVTVSDGKITFSFEVPDHWLTETRNSGEVEMNEEELREYFTTSHYGDIKTNPDLSGSYWDFTWDMLKSMSYDEMMEYFKMKRDEDSPGYPNASVSSNKVISYLDVNSYQTDFYILPQEDFEKYFTSNDLVLDTTIGDMKARVVMGKSTGDPGSGGRAVYIFPEGSSKFILIEKQYYPMDDHQEDFDRLLDTFRLQ